MTHCQRQVVDVDSAARWTISKPDETMKLRLSSQIRPGASETAFNNNNEKNDDDDTDDAVLRCCSRPDEGYDARRYLITGKDATATDWSTLAGAAWKNDELRSTDSATNAGEREDVTRRQWEKSSGIDDNIGCSCWNDTLFTTKKVYSPNSLYSSILKTTI